MLFQTLRAVGTNITELARNIHKKMAKKVSKYAKFTYAINCISLPKARDVALTVIAGIAW
jgi:hypothetical protein